MRVWVSPEGKRFRHIAPAVMDVFRSRVDLAVFYKDYAPLTWKWLHHQERFGELDRPTQFDRFLKTILNRAGYREEDINAV